MKGNIQKTSGKEEPQDEQAGSVDEIKKKYGFSSSSNVSLYLESASSIMHDLHSTI